MRISYFIEKLVQLEPQDFAVKMRYVYKRDGKKNIDIILQFVV